MVKIEKNKLVIEIETAFPCGDLVDLQKEIINVIRQYDYKEYGNNDECSFCVLLDLLETTLPDEDYYKGLLSRKKN